MAKRTMLLSILAIGLCELTSLAADPPTTPPAKQPTTDKANPLPGITIDKQRRRVMLECTSLQAGVPLELVACSPHSREHESLVVVKARPQHVHLALMLCGYEPGHPATWDEKTDKPVPASGDPLDVQIRWVDPKTEKIRTVNIEDWMAAADPAKPVPKLMWLFTGSQQLESGQYLGDLDGSVVSISNFPDSVIDLSGQHTRDNASLEFKGNDRVMPPRDTACTLIIMPPVTIPVELDRFGKVLINGKAVPLPRQEEMLAAHARSRDDARVRLIASPDAVPADIDRLKALFKKAGFADDRIDRGAPASQPGAFIFPANDPAAAWELLAGQWQVNLTTIQQNVAAQRQWFEQLQQRRDVLAQQYSEVASYVSHVREQYNQTMTGLRGTP